MKITWADFEEICDNRGLDVLMVEKDDSYFLYASEHNFQIECQLIKGTESCNHFEAEHKALCNPKRVDLENSAIVRIKYCKLGWKYWSYSFEFETSKLYSLISNRWDAACTATSIKFLDEYGAELTTQQDIDTDCVVTQIDWMPTIDIEMIAGRIRQQTIPSEDDHIFVRCAPAIPAAYGGEVDFVSNFNMKYLGATDELLTDGRASKYITYIAGTDANKFRFELRHSAGFKHKAQITLEFFRA